MKRATSGERRIMNVAAFVSNVFSLVLSVLLFYFGVRVLVVLKKVSLRGGKPSRTWIYMSVGSIVLAVGSVIFLISLYFNLTFLRPLGGIAHMLAGVLLLLGFNNQYKIWKQTLR
jgi:hypothetical protein